MNTTSKPEPKTFREHLAPVVFVVYLLGIYLNIGISTSSRYVGGLLAIAAAFMYFPFIKRKIEPVFWGSIFFTITALCTVLNFQITENYASRINPSILIGLAVFSAIVVFRCLQSIRRRTLIIIISVFAIVFLVGTALEVFGPLRPVSDGFRNAVFADAFVYDSEGRDVEQYGSVRPNFFSQEPSHLGKLLGLLTFCAFALRPAPINAALSALIFLASLYLSRSPSIIPGFFLVVILWFNLLLRRANTQRYFNVAACLAIIGFIISLPLIASMLPGVRADAIARNLDLSAIERYAAPVWIFINAWSINPLTGIGLGTHGFYVDLVVDAYSHFPAYIFYRLKQGDLNFGWYSAFYEGLACLGFFGFLAVLVSGMKMFPVANRWIFLPIFTTVTLLDSGFPSPRVWGYIAIYMFFFDYAMAQMPRR